MPRFNWFNWILPFALFVACMSCASDEASQQASGSEGAGDSASGSDVAPAASTGAEPAEPDLGPPPGSSSTGDGALSVQPIEPVLTAVAGQAQPTVAFQAFSDGVPVVAHWAIDRGELGSIDEDGLFTASGLLGGSARVTASYADVTATTTVSVQLQESQLGDPAWTATPLPPGPGGHGGVGGDGPAPAPSAEQVTALDAAAQQDTAVRLLYPYDGTVFPQGLLAPLLQWNPAGHAFDAVKVRVTGTHYLYEGYFAANAQPFVNVPIPQPAWQAMTRSGSGEELEVTLVFAEGAQAYGPYTLRWVVAAAQLQGAIYYNSYGTSYVKNSSDLDVYGEQYGAGTLAISSGAKAPTLVAGIDGSLQGEGCRGCHTVSGDGSLLVTQGTKSMPDLSDTVSIDLLNDTTGGAGEGLPAAPTLTFPALSRQGGLLLSNAGGPHGGNATQLYALPGAQLVTDVAGLPEDFRAGLPAFSADGEQLSFNLWAGSFEGLQADGRSLAVLDFDGVNAFSNPRVLFTPPGSSPDVAVTFSSFLPDSSAVVFALQLGNPSQFWGYTWGENTSELWWVDLATAQARRLDTLNGYTAGGASYLPDNASGVATHSAEQDATLNYEPSVSPIAAGGYAWVVFTTRRMYGNVAADVGPWQSDPRRYGWREQVTSKKLWVAAIDLGAEPGSDPSHPPFYLPAQELYAGNSRGFWSPEPCREDGLSCASGVQCCGGHCQQGQAGLVCGSQLPECSPLFDRCDIDADCCDAPGNASCINSVCTAPQPPMLR